MRAPLILPSLLMACSAMLAPPASASSTAPAAAEAPSSAAQAGDSWWDGIFDETQGIGLGTSLYTMHFNPKPEHNNHQHLIDLRWLWRSGYLVGFSHFQNSFDQPTQFAYLGRRWDIPHTEEMLYASLVGGLLHGYDGEHKDAIPLNDHGVAPGILPILGLRYQAVRSEIILFGTAGRTLTLGVDLPLR